MNIKPALLPLLVIFSFALVIFISISGISTEKYISTRSPAVNLEVND